MLKKYFKKLYRLLIWSFNILSLTLLAFIAVSLVVISFNIPINFFNHYIQETIFNNKITINKIYIRWDYLLNKPVITVDDVVYLDKDNNVSFYFKSLGVSVDVKRLIKDKKVYPNHIILEDFVLNVTRTQKNNIIFNSNNFYNQKLDKTSNKKIKESSNELNKAVDLMVNSGVISAINYYKNKYQYLSYLSSMIINNAKVNFDDEVKKQNLEINLTKILINFKDREVSANLKGNIHNKNNNKHITINSNFSLDSLNNIFFKVAFDNFSPEFIDVYYKNFLKHMRIKGFNSNISVSGIYKISKNKSFFDSLNSVDATVNTGSGVFSSADTIIKYISIKSINTDLEYRKSTGKIRVKKFVAVTDSFINLNIKKDVSKVYLKSISSSLEYSFNDDELDIDDITLNVFSNNKIHFSGKYKNNKNFNSFLDFAISTNSNIDFSYLDNIWPSNLEKEAYNWVFKNVRAGQITAINVNGEVLFKKDEVILDNLFGKINVKDGELTYLDGMPVATSPNVDITFDADSVEIKYDNAVTGNITSNRGVISIAKQISLNNVKQDSILSLDLDVSSNIDNAIKYISLEPLNLIKNIPISSNTISGDVKGNVKLDVNLENAKVYNTNVDIIVDNLIYKNVFKNIDANNGKINVKYINDKLSAYGNLSYDDIDFGAFLIFEKNAKDNSKYNYKINLFSKKVDLYKIAELELLPDEVLKRIDGEVALNIEIINDNAASDKVNLEVDLKDATLDIDEFDYHKEKAIPFKIYLDMDLNKDNTTTVNMVNIKAQDIEGFLQFNKGQDNKSSSTIIRKLYIKDKADISGYIYNSDKDLNMNISGKYLDITSIAKKYKKEMQEEKPKVEDAPDPATGKIDSKTAKKPKNYQIKITLDKITNNNVSLSNFYYSLNYYNGVLNDLSFVSTSSNNDKRNTIVIFNKNLGRLSLKVSNVGEIISFFDINSDIVNGYLDSDINLKQDSNKIFVSKGSLFITDITLGSIPYSYCEINFSGKNYYFNIDNLILQGNIIGGNLKGNIDLDNSTIDLSGYITPIWGTNQILKRLPFLSNIINSISNSNIKDIVKFGDQTKDKNKGIVNITLHLSGNLKDIKYSFSKPKKVDSSKQVEEKPESTTNNIYNLKDTDIKLKPKSRNIFKRIFN